MEIDLELRWYAVVDDQRVEIDRLVFALLRGVAAAGQLNSAAQAEGVSYRHAWGLLRTWEQRVGAPLVVARRGRGATLTKFGAGLLQACEETDKSLRETLSKQALRTSASVDAAMESDRRRVRIASSHNERILHLRETLEGQRREVTMEIVGSEAALRLYRRGDADLAGFHLPMGELGRTVAAKLIGFLDDKHDEMFLVENRVLGLMSRSERPCRTIDDLVAEDWRFVNRQSGSATRLTFDGLLGTRGLAPGSINGYHDEEHTHTAVAARVVSRDADVAFGSRGAAEHFDLAFEPMVEERFYLVINRDFDHPVRQYVSDFCKDSTLTGSRRLKADEFAPTVAVMKRVHNAGFWKHP